LYFSLSFKSRLRPVFALIPNFRQISANVSSHCQTLHCLDLALILPESVTDVSGHTARAPQDAWLKKRLGVLLKTLG
jgi:hypothetical protein